MLAEKGLSVGLLAGTVEKKAPEVEPEETAAPSTDCREMLAQISSENTKRTCLQAERAFMNQRVVDATNKETKSRRKQKSLEKLASSVMDQVLHFPIQKK